MEPLEGIACQELLEDKPTHQGHVMKEGNNSIFSPVVQRYLVLHKGCLYCYKDYNRPSPHKTLSLTGYKAGKDIGWRNQPWPFILRNVDIEKKAYVFGCSSESERDEWVKHINKTVKGSETEETCYNYAAEPIVKAKQEPLEMYMPMNDNQFSEPFNGPTVLPRRSSDNMPLPKVPLAHARSHSPIRKSSDQTDAGRNASTLPGKAATQGKPALPPRPRPASTSCETATTTTKKKYSYEFTEIGSEKHETNAESGSESRLPRSNEKNVEVLACTRGVPDGEISPPSIYDRPDAEVVPASALQPDMDRVQSESILGNNTTCGTYLIRKDRSKVNQVVTVVFDKSVYHYKVFRQGNGNVFLDKKHPSFESLPALINYYYYNFLPTVDKCLSTPYQ